MPEKKDDVFDLNGIRQLVELMRENNVSELDLEQCGAKLSLRRAIQSVAPVAVAPVPVATPAPVAADCNAGVPAEADYIKTFKAPMVGVFYSSPNPDSPAFVKVGDFISSGKTICIIEAMKVFNDIPSDLSGKVVEVIAKDGDSVEYGTPLFKIDVR